MRFRTAFVPLLALSLASPAFAQSPIMDRFKENAQRRAENKAVREAEHPEDQAKPAAAPTPTAPAPAAAPAAPAPATADATPAAPAAPAATPATQPAH